MRILCWEIKFVGFKKWKEWQKLALMANDSGVWEHKIGAIKMCRQETGVGLREAKDAVEAFMFKHQKRR